MKSYPRIRMVVKWGGAVVTVLVVTVWAWSVIEEWYAVYRAQNGSVVAIMAGRFALGWRDSATRKHSAYVYGLEIDACSAHAWNFGWLDGRSGWELGIPLWFVAGVPLLASVIAWRLDTLAYRRVLAGFCPSCDYNRIGLATDAKCPECGAATTNRQPAGQVMDTDNPDVPR